MKMTFACVVFLVPVLLAAADQPSFPKLKTFAPKGSGFSLAMPGEPKEEKSSVPLTVGKEKIGGIEIRSYRVEQDGLIFEIVTTRYPLAALAITGNTPDKILNNRVEIEIEAGGGKGIQQKKIALGKYPGREIQRDTEGGKNTTRMRIYQAGTWQITVNLSGPKQLVASKEAAKFFGSLKLTK